MCDLRRVMAVSPGVGGLLRVEGICLFFFSLVTEEELKYCRVEEQVQTAGVEGDDEPAVNSRGLRLVVRPTFPHPLSSTSSPFPVHDFLSFSHFSSPLSFPSFRISFSSLLSPQPLPPPFHPNPQDGENVALLLDLDKFLRAT